VDAKFPLGKFICVTGVSGSGKSTFINETLYPILSNMLMVQNIPLEYRSVKGLEHIDKVIEIDNRRSAEHREATRQRIAVFLPR
jgi:excinuclease ABC subunit A